MNTTLILFLLGIGYALLALAIKLIAEAEYRKPILVRLYQVLAAKDKTEPPLTPEEVDYFTNSRWD